MDNIFNESLAHLSDPGQKLILYQLLKQYQCLFDTSVPSIANLTAPPMINTGSHPPVHSHVYRTDPIKQKHLTDTINEMLKHGQIEKSYASWSSPVILVKKKDGSYRFVVDYRSLNNITLSPTIDQSTLSSPSLSSELNVPTSMDNIFNESLAHLSDPDQKLILYQLLKQYQCLFDTSVPSIANLTAPPMINTGS
ncbi:unnamed protein product, partial [Rotaria sp. Silwood2]